MWITRKTCGDYCRNVLNAKRLKSPDAPRKLQAGMYQWTPKPRSEEYRTALAKKARIAAARTRKVLEEERKQMADPRGFRNWTPENRAYRLSV